MTALGIATPGADGRSTRRPALAARLAWTLAPVAVAAGLGLLLRDHLASPDLAMLMLLAVVVVAARSTRWMGVAGTLLAILLFDLLFVTPYYRLTVHDTAYLVTFVVMLGVGLAIGHLTGALREAALVRAARERVATARLALSELLTDAHDLDDVAVRSARLLADETGAPVRVLLTPPAPTVEAVLDGLELPVADHGLRDGLVAVLAGDAAHFRTVDGWMVHRVHDGLQVRGITAVEPTDAGTPAATVALTDALLEQLALILERREAAFRHESARVEVEAERLRIALLSAVSHDLRTPLAAIEGAASTMLTGPLSLSDQVRTSLLESIQEEARRMNRLIGNLLDMVRVETGALAVHRSWQPIEEVIGVVLLRMEPRLDGREVLVSLPDDLPLVAIDELLVEQLFINLLENVRRHVPGTAPVEITGAVRDGALELTIRDHGPGFPPDRLDTVLDRFAHPPSRPSTPEGGLGLGLSICRGIVEAHGGTLTAANHPEGGALITIRFPIGTVPRAPRDDEDTAA